MNITMKYGKWFLAVVIGGAAGYLYWYFVGCNSGSCAITSSPVNSSVYGGLMGVLLVNAFQRRQPPAEKRQDPHADV